MTVTHTPTGNIVIEARTDKWRIQMTYMWYTRREATQRFKQHLKELNAEEIK